jgi:hypothetical protein
MKKRIEIAVEWKKNRTWGRNPHAHASLVVDGVDTKHSKARCSGCGYDKLSTVAADCLNELLEDELDALPDKDFQETEAGKPHSRIAPYGIHRYHAVKGKGKTTFSHAVGIESTLSVLKYMGYKVERHQTGMSDFILAEKES